MKTGNTLKNHWFMRLVSLNHDETMLERRRIYFWFWIMNNHNNFLKYHIFSIKYFFNIFMVIPKPEVPWKPKIWIIWKFWDRSVRRRNQIEFPKFQHIKNLTDILLVKNKIIWKFYFIIEILMTANC